MVIIALSTGATAWLLDPAIDKIFLDKDESMLLLIPIAIILTLFIKSIAHLYTDRITKWGSTKHNC